MVGPPTGATDARLLALVGVGDADRRLSVSRIGARVAVLLEQPGVPALLHGLQAIEEELRGGPTERALAEVRRRIGPELGGVEAPVVERDRLAGGRLSHAREAGRDVGAVADRVAARGTFQPGTGADVAPADRHQVLVVARTAG